MFMPTVVIAGQVAGLWKRTLKKDKLILTLSPFASFSQAESQAIRPAAERYRHFMGLSGLDLTEEDQGRMMEAD